MADIPLNPNHFEEAVTEVHPELELPEEEEVSEEAFEQLIGELTSNPLPPLGLLEEEVSDEETVVLDSEDQPEVLNDFESGDDIDSMFDPNYVTPTPSLTHTLTELQEWSNYPSPEELELPEDAERDSPLAQTNTPEE
jgi:hypothetical protein